MVRTVASLSSLPWVVTGYHPYEWRPEVATEPPEHGADVAPIPAPVPGSVQQALRNAGLLPDWMQGLNSRACEWVENRHWIYRTTIPASWFPAEHGMRCRLRFLGLDGSGWIRINGTETARFAGSHLPLTVEIDRAPVPPAGAGGSHADPGLPGEGSTADQQTGTAVTLEVVFASPPRWLGQIGHTSRMLDAKVRFNYRWDWTARLVQIGIWDQVLLECFTGPTLEGIRVAAGLERGDSRAPGGSTGTPAARSAGTLRVWIESPAGGSPEPGRRRGERAVHGSITHGSIRLVLKGPDGPVVEREFPASRLKGPGIRLGGLPVFLWWPACMGEPTLYLLTLELYGAGGELLDRESRRVGFRSISWRRNPGAPAHADPWLCAVNGKTLFLQGVNWTPIRQNFADLTENDYRERISTYRRLGVNILRVWGGGFLERRWFYDLCD